MEKGARNSLNFIFFPGAAAGPISTTANRNQLNRMQYFRSCHSERRSKLVSTSQVNTAFNPVDCRMKLPDLL
jgi:hypothetical protein